MAHPLVPRMHSSADALPQGMASRQLGLMPGIQMKTDEEFCRAMLALPPYIAAHGMDQNARQVAEAACAHFDSALRLHLETQETGLFPALLLQAGSARIQYLLDALKAEHLTLAATWIRLRQSLNAIEYCHLTSFTFHDVEAFTLPYLNHLWLEAEQLQPEAILRLLEPRGISTSNAALRLCPCPPPAPHGPRRWAHSKNGAMKPCKGKLAPIQLDTPPDP